MNFQKPTPKNVPTKPKKVKSPIFKKFLMGGGEIEYLCTYDVIITFKVNLGTMFADAYAETKVFYHATLFTEYTKTDFPFRAIHYFFPVKIHLTVFIFSSRSVIGPWEELIQKHNLTTLKGFDDVFIPQRHTDWCFNKTKVCM